MNKDIVQHLFSLLNTNTLLKYRLVCKQWSRIGLLFIHELTTLPPNDEQLKPFKLLTALNLVNNNTITDDGLKHTLLLTTLHLWGNNRITDDGLKHTPLLTTLNLEWNVTITDEGLKHISKKCKIIKK